jgi:nicotinate-nucleotide pyrophosphorylase (carboxylating)
MPATPDLDAIIRQVRQALAEDVGDGDLTAQLVPDAMYSASIVARETAILCGGAWLEQTYRQLDPDIRIDWQRQDGDRMRADETVCVLHGHARPLLTGERCALNFLQTLSGTATLTRELADLLSGTRTRLLDTRKTIPGLRLAQKYAVRTGGGHNHRLGLFDAILIKENHIAAAGGIQQALRQARAMHPGIEIEIEVEDLEQLQTALDAGARRILLDNFSLPQLRRAVTVNAGRARLEASGNINRDNIRTIAETGVDDISIGALTKHLRAIDLSMRFRPLADD